MDNSKRPAYPNACASWLDDDQEFEISGLTKREYFAAMAMQGILANSPDWDNQEKHHEMVAKMSIGYANELLKQLPQ
jgi:hypothetical protein